jgi:uncharacterized protein YjiK
MRMGGSIRHGMVSLPFYFFFFVPLASGIVPARAQSLASRLAEFQAVARVPAVAGVTAKSFSGVALHPVTRSLYVIDNDNAVVYVLDTAGTLLRAIISAGLADPEGIAYQADDYFLITEEGLANIVRLKLPRTGTNPIAKASGTVLNIGSNMANSGIEGVAYRAADHTAFAVKEIDPPRLYRIRLDSAGVPAAAFPDDPFDISKKSGDAADIAALEDGSFILVNQEQDRLEGYDAQGKALGNLPLGMAKPEGIAFDAATETIYVVGEPAEFAAFRRQGSAIRPDGRREDGFKVTLAQSGATGNAAVTLNLDLPRAESVRVSVADPHGSWREVRQGRFDPGPHAISLGALPPGVSLWRIAAGSRERILKLVAY